MSPPRPERPRTLADHLALLESGFDGPRSMGGHTCAVVSPGARLLVPEHTSHVLLRCAAPPGGAPPEQALTLRDETGRPLPVDWMPGEVAFALVSDLRAATHLVFEAPDTASATLLLDAAFFDAAPSTTVDFDAPARPEGRPLVLRLDLTNKCNLRCRMCSLSFDEVFHQPKDFTSASEFRAAFREILPRVGHVALSAGFEPLLNPDFPGILAAVHDAGVPSVEFTTNGTRLTEELMHAFVDHGVHRVFFSVDGARAATYEHIRRGARFDRFLRALEIFHRVREERGVSHPELAFNMVLMRRNVEELPDVVRLGARYGLDVMNTAILIPNAGLGMEKEVLQLDRARANEAFRKARAVLAELGIRGSVPEDFDLSKPAEDVPVLPTVGAEYTFAESWGPADTLTATADETAGDSGLGAESEFELAAIEGAERAHLVKARRSAASGAPPGARRPARPAPAPRTETEPTVSPSPTASVAPSSEGDTASEESRSATVIKPGSAALGQLARDDAGRPVATACSYPWTLAMVRSDKRVVPCCQWHDWETMGDLRHQSFEAIWNGPAYRKLRLELQSGRFRPTCAHCPERQEL